MSGKAQTIVEVAESKIGDPYVFGAWGEPCTPAIRKQYAGYNPQHANNIRKKCAVLNGSASSCAGCAWDGHLCYDCRGFTYFLLKQVGIKLSGGGATSQWNTSGNWAAKGKIADGMPDLVCCVFKQSGTTMQHTGMHVGGGEIIHCSSGVQHGKTTDKGWTHWAVPDGLYTEQELKEAGVVKLRKTLKKGVNGEEVKQLQEMLNGLGFKLDTDGKFGTMTLGAVATFQEQNGLDADGVVGAKTWAAIEAALVAAETAKAGAICSTTGTMASNPEAEHSVSGLTTDDPESEVEKLQDELSALEKTLNGIRGVVADLIEDFERLKYAIK